MNPILHFIIDIPISYKNSITIEPQNKFNIQKEKIEDINNEKNQVENFYHFIASSKVNKKKEKISINVKFNSLIYSNEFEFDFKNSKFLFNLKFTQKKNHSNIMPMNSLSKYQQFKVYMEYLKKNDLQNDIQFLINDIFNNLKEETIQFELILLLLRECYTNPNLKIVIELLNDKDFTFENVNEIEIERYEKIIEILTIKFRDGNINKLFITPEEMEKKEKGLDKLAMIFFKYCIPNKYLEFFENNKDKNHLFSILFDCKVLLPLNEQESFVLSKYISDLNQLKNFLKFLINRKLFVDILKEKYDFIIKNLGNNKEFELEEFPDISKKDDIKYIFTNLTEILKKGKINLKSDFTYKYITLLYEENNLEDFFLLNQWLKNSLFKCNDLSEYNKNLQSLVKKKSKKLDLKKTLELIVFFQKEKINLEPFDIKEISNKFDFSKINEDIIKLFQNINIEKLKKKDIKLTDLLFSKIKNLEHIEIMYKLFPVKKTKNNYVADLFKKKVIILIDSNNIDNEKLPQIIVNTIEICKHNNIKINTILESILKLNQNQISSIYSKIILYYDNNDLPQELFPFFLKQINSLNSQQLFDLILFFFKKKSSFVCEIFNRISDSKIVNEDDFFEEKNENFKFCNNLIFYNFFDGYEYSSTKYIKNSSQKLNSIKTLLLEKKYSYEKIIKIEQLQSSNILTDRLKCIFYKEQDKVNYYMGKIIEQNQKAKEKKNDLQIFLSFAKKYLPNSLKESINDLSNQQKSFSTIQDYISLVLPDDILSKAKSFQKEDNSKFFFNIYECLKRKSEENDEKKLLEDTKRKFYGLKEFIKDKNTNIISEEEISIIVQKINSEKELINEISLLKDLFFGNQKIDISNSEKLFLLIYSKEKIQKHISFLIKLFQKFYIDMNENDELFKKINNINKKFENVNFEELIEINDEIKMLNLEIINEKKCQKILFYLFEKDFINFLENKTLDDIRNLQDFAGEDIESYNIDMTDLQSLENCIFFIQELTKMKNSNLKNFCDNFIELIKRQNFSDLETNVEKISQKFPVLSTLYSEQFNKDFLAKKNIEQIYDNSSFDIKYNNSEYFCEVDYDYTNKNKEKKKFEDILDYKDNALMRKKDNKKDNNFYDICVKFVEIIRQISKIIKSLNIIANKGYYEYLNYKITIKKGKVECLKFENELKKENLTIEQLIQQLKDITKEQNSKEKEFYKKQKLTRLIYGKQFYIIFSSVKNKKQNEIYYLNKYLTNNNYDEQQEINCLYISTNDPLKDMYETVNDYIEKLFEHNNLTYEKIFENSKIKNKDYHGLYCYKTKSDLLVKDCIKASKFLTENIPIAHTILYCSIHTSKEEITSFLYRALKSDFNSFFMIITPENLSLSNKRLILTLIQKLYKKDKSDSYCVLFFYIQEDNDLINQIKNISQIFKFKDEDNDTFKSFKLKDMNDIKVYCSDASGVGKSTLIKDQLDKLNCKYIYFPIGGNITKKDILDRLLKLDKCNNIGLHIDLNDTNQYNLIEEFLFLFLITKYYGINENIFYYGKEIKIIIEVPNGFINYFEKYPILEIFESEKIFKEKLPQLKISKEIDSNIQIVCNYLKLYDEKKINNNNVFVENLSLQYFYKRSIKIATLSKKFCENLIKKHFPGDNLTYYQINSFINILGEQLKYLTNNYYLEVDHLNNLITNGRKKLSQIRNFIIESLIKLTKHFITSAYDNLLKEQTNNQNQFQNFENVIIALQDKKSLNFDDIQPSLVFFNEDKHSISIVTNSDKNSTEYQNLKELYNSNKTSDFQECIDYKHLNNNEFLIEIKKILDLREKTEYLQKIVESYVFTPDNFIKMILILLRIRANIPVILMGETGCGKTYLIRMISKLKKNRMEILNIHAGITDKEIIEFIEKKTNDINNNLNDIIKNENNLILNNNAQNKNIKIEPEKVNLNTNLLNNKVNTINEKQIGNLIINENDKKNKKNISESNNLKKNENFVSKKSKLEIIPTNEVKEKKEEKLWIFLDEINTCNSMGLISEIICKHSYYGKPINKNIQFIAACNPYRCKSKKFEEIGLTKKIKTNKIQNLIYIVNPLPHSLLNFVFDFGNIRKEDEKRYIENMIDKPLEKIVNKKNEIKIKKSKSFDLLLHKPIEIKNSFVSFRNKQISNKNNLEEMLNKIKKNLKTLIVDAITTCQNFIRDKYDISSVSLREVRRFILFYEWFVDFLERKKNEEDKFKNFDYKNLNEEQLHKYAINLSVYICYYIRIYRKDYRKELKEEMNKIFNYKNKKDFEYLPLLISEQIAYEVDLEEGIAKNRALLDNLFALFICINNKIPLFICGKPGCSKSLSVQLIFKSMIGVASNSKFFKNEPRLLRHSYQGSLTSTSAGVLKIFDTARKSIHNKNIKNTISVIFFDEMGLAEISPNNPLKVIHSQLEYDDNEKDKVAFIGISNWTLDASKMNRGIYLSIPEPDEEDLIETAIKISESYGLNAYKDEIVSLAKSYYKYKEILNNKSDYEKEFHGSRDFYHLIKVFSTKMKKATNKVENILNMSIERNFGGLKDSILNFKKILDSNYKKNLGSFSEFYEVKEIIKDNMRDMNSRYLLLITNISISEYLINSLLEDLGLNKTVIYYIGSKFEKDLKEENYSATILNKIQYTISQENIMILRNLDSIYPSLYDLFNQNFMKAGKKNYARIALGYSKTHSYYVNDNFKCIVLLDSEDIEKQDPPFLNRFEKHLFSLDLLLNNNLKEFSKEKYQKIIELISDNDLNIDLSKELINCNLEEIEGIVYKNNKINNTNLPEKIIETISPSLSQDIICYIKNFSSNKNIQIYKQIIDYYKKYDHNNISKYLEKINTPKHIIYTFSNIFQNIINKDINNQKYGTFNSDNTLNIFIQDCKEEKEIEEQIELLYNNEKTNLFIFHLNILDCVHLNHINYLINNYENEKNISQNEQKVILFIVYLKRDFKSSKNELKKEKTYNKNNYLLSHLIDYPQIFIDNLEGKDLAYIDIIDYNTEKLLDEIELINLDEEFKKQLYPSFCLINYSIKKDDGNFKVENYISNCCNFIMKEENKKCMIKFVKQQIVKNEENIFNHIFYDNIIEKKDIDLISIISKYLCNLFKIYLNESIIKIERNGILSCLLTSNYLKEKDILFQISLESIDFQEIQIDNNFQKNNVSLMLGLNFPLSLNAFQNMQLYIELYKNDFLINESLLLNAKYDKKKNNLLNCEKKKKEIIGNVSVEFGKQNLMELINNIKMNERFSLEEVIEYLIKDYLMIFLLKYNKTINNEIIKLFENITIKFYNSKDDIENTFTNIILFYEGYSNIFQIIINILTKSSVFFPKIYDILFKKIKGNIEEKKIKINDISINIIIESLIISIMENVKNFNYENDPSGKIFFRIIDFLKEVSNNIMQFNYENNLHLKELFTLITFIKVQETLDKNNKSNSSNIKKYLELVQGQFNNLEQIEKAIKLFENEYQFLKKNIRESDFPELIVDIFSQRIKYISNSKYREKMFEFIIQDNRILILSQRLFYIFLSSYSLIPININENNNEEICKNSFSSIFIEKTKIKNLINDTKKEMLDEILLYLFEIKINSYFHEIKDPNEQLLNLSLTYFKISVEFIEDNNFQISSNKLEILYYITYIKCYCLILSDQIYDENKNQLIDKTEINNFLNSKDNNFRKVIKLYILKCINILKLKSYDKLKNFDFKFHQINWINEFNLEEPKKSNLDYLFLDIENIELYKNIYEQFVSDKNIQFSGTTKSIQELISEKININLLYDITINEIISNLCDEKYLKESDIYFKFTSYILTILNDLNIISDNSKKLLKIFYVFDDKMNFIKNKPDKEYEILLYSHKIAFICSQGKDNSFYKNLLSSKISKIINKNFIPGSEPIEDKIYENFNNIKSYLEEKNSMKYGLYICSCNNYFYTIDPPGIPNQIFECPNCKKKIGGDNNYNLVKREGHIRIYLDKKQKEEVEKLKIYKPFKSKLLLEYQKEIEKLKHEEKGIKKVSLVFFQTNEKNVRQLNIITYRLLSFIFYSCIYYSYILEFIKEEELKNYLFNEEIDITMIINENWDLLHGLLLENGIQSNQIFLNIIFPKLSNILDNVTNFETKELRKSFEEKINKLVNETIINYSKLQNKYISLNNEILKIDNSSIKSILQETVDPRKIDQKNYPLIGYFTVPKYPSEEDFWEEIKKFDKNKISVIKAYNENITNISKLQNILLMNPFENYALMKYSNNITRNEAKNTKIKEQLNTMNDENIKQLYKDFEKGYNSMSDNSIKYENYKLEKEKKISLDDPIAYILNDNNELDYGMYIAAAYYKFTEYQNSFLNAILLNIEKSELKYFKKQINNLIIPQNATNLEVVNLNISNEFVNSFYELISFYSYRNCFDKNGKIIYNNYRDIKYEIQKIELELGRILLPGKRKFSKEQNFIIYSFEDYSEKHSNAISIFIENFPQVKLVKEKKINLKEIIEANSDYETIVTNLYTIIFYYQDKKKNISPKDSIIKAVEYLPKIIQISQVVKKKFDTFYINEIIEIIEFIEYIVFNIIKNKIEQKYKIKLNEAQKKSLNEYFEKTNEIFFKKKILLTTIRKYISKYLLMNKQKNKNREDETKNIFEILKYKPELWPKEIIKDKNEFTKNIDELINNVSIQICNSIDLYEFFKDEKEEISSGIEPIREKENTKEKKRAKNFIY